MRFLTTAATALATAVSGLLAVASPAAAASTCATVPAIAHRGITTSAVENTYGSIQAAIDAEVAFEVDLRTTLDGALVLMHDATVRRTTTGTGWVANKTRRAIRRLSTDDGQAVPFIEEVLRMVQAAPAEQEVVLDLKDLTPESQDLLAANIAHFGLAERISAISFSPDLLNGIETRTPAVDTFLIHRGTTAPTPETLTGWDGTNISYSLLTPEWTAQMEAIGLTYNLRTVNDATGWETGGQYQVGWAMTDQVAAYRDYCTT